jgi:hypothetical protein
MDAANVISFPQKIVIQPKEGRGFVISHALIGQLPQLMRPLLKEAIATAALKSKRGATIVLDGDELQKKYRELKNEASS